MSTSPQQRAAIVTGGANGIGLRIVSALEKAGWRLAVLDRDQAGLDALGAAHPALVLHRVDLQDPAAGRAAVESVVDRLGGRLDGLVNNAGGSADTPLRFEEVTGEHFDRVVGWNLKATFFTTQAALPFLVGSGGAVVNIAAIAGRAGTDLLPAQYSGAKAGVIGLTRNLACQLGSRGVRVNAVSPGFTVSGERVERIWREREDSARILEMIPLRRRGTSEEVAAAVEFLLSESASYTTGAVLDVNGGFFCV